MEHHQTIAHLARASRFLAPSTLRGSTRHVRTLGAAAAIVALFLCACHATGNPAASGARAREPGLGERVASARPDAEEVRTVASLVDRRRRARGCQPLIWDERLARVAQRHSEAMARRGFFSHVDRHGNDPFDRLRQAGIRFRAAAENIAAGQTSGREVFEGWLRSRGHRANLENCAYTHHGIGLYRNRWTHVFARF